MYLVYFFIVNKPFIFSNLRCTNFLVVFTFKLLWSKNSYKLDSMQHIPLHLDFLPRPCGSFLYLNQDMTMIFCLKLPESVLTLPSSVLRFICFQDLVQLVNADQPYWLIGMTEMTRTFGLELLESVLTNFSSVFFKVC